MNCAGVREKIDLLLTGSLSEAEAVKLERHLHSCEACARWKASYEAFLQELEKPRPVTKTDPQLDMLILQKGQTRRRSIPVLVPAGAAAGALIIAIVLLIFHQKPVGHNVVRVKQEPVIVRKTAPSSTVVEAPRQMDNRVRVVKNEPSHRRRIERIHQKQCVAIRRESKRSTVRRVTSSHAPVTNSVPVAVKKERAPMPEIVIATIKPIQESSFRVEAVDRNTGKTRVISYSIDSEGREISISVE